MLHGLSPRAVNVRCSGAAADDEGGELALPPNDALRHRGPVLAAFIRLPDALSHNQSAGLRETVQGWALVDTGASSTCIDQEEAQRAGLPIIDYARISSASHANHEVPVFAGRIEIPSFGVLDVPRAMGVALGNQGLIALVGRDALMNAVLVYNGLDGSISLSL